ncbi:MAG TPA: TMEM175 family protein [Puia sp.]|nr:TMEM175 family protein [Puia sp.]
MDHLEKELKKEFQLERMILFSDAVFAIAITLLILEIRIPEISGNVTDKLLLQALAALGPKFVGFIISFMLIGMYWTIHHRMFGYVINYNQKLLWLNLFFLFFIILMPFSTGFYGEYTGAELIKNQLKVPMTFYVLNFCFVGLFNFIMWIYVTNPKNKLMYASALTSDMKLSRARALVVPIIFFCMLPVAYFFNVAVAVYIPLMIPIVMKIVHRFYREKTESISK